MGRLSRGGGVFVRAFETLRQLAVWRASHAYSKGIFVSRGAARRLLTPWALVLVEVSQVFCRQEYLEFDYNLYTFELRDSVRFVHCTLGMERRTYLRVLLDILPPSLLPTVPSRKLPLPHLKLLPQRNRLLAQQISFSLVHNSYSLSRQRCLEMALLSTEGGRDQTCTG